MSITAVEEVLKKNPNLSEDKLQNPIKEKLDNQFTSSLDDIVNEDYSQDLRENTEEKSIFFRQ